jgi:hypothetical protein
MFTVILAFTQTLLVLLVFRIVLHRRHARAREDGCLFRCAHIGILRARSVMRRLHAIRNVFLNEQISIGASSRMSVRGPKRQTKNRKVLAVGANDNGFRMSAGVRRSGLVFLQAGLRAAER